MVIPTRDREPILARTLESLRPQAAGAEIIVVRDGPDQPQEQISGVRTEIVGQGGPGAARNHGVKVTDRPLILFLGDDMLPDRGLVDRHLARHAAEPDDRVAVQGNMVWHDDCGSNPLNLWLDASALQFDLDAIPPGGDAGWGRFYSSNVSLKRSLFEKAGGFDPEFTYYYEDLDLARRLHEAGMVLRFEEQALARHLHDYDVERLGHRFAGVARGELLMRQKHAWFEPWFEPRFRAARAGAPERAVWATLVRLPLPGPARSRIEGRAQRWYWQTMAEAFLDSWDATLDLVELREYLGEEFDESRLWNHGDEVEREESVAPDERTFYRTSTAYLYDLTAFGTWPTKVPYRSLVRRLCPPGGTLLDYGCGIGSDGLRLAADGFRVAFADFDNPSTRYLEWRLGRRGLDLPVYDVEADVPGGFDLAYAFDVIEHVEEPMAFLEELERRAAVVVVNLLEEGATGTSLHRPLPIGSILARARQRGLLHRRRHHGRSLLIAYRGDRR